MKKFLIFIFAFLLFTVLQISIFIKDSYSTTVTIIIQGQVETTEIVEEDFPD